MAERTAAHAGQRNVEAVRRGFAAAGRGELGPVRDLLAPGVRWHAAGDAEGGCQNREQALEWMGDAIGRGIQVDLIDARPLGEDRVVAVLQRRADGPGEPPAPHGEVLTFRAGRVVEMVVYPSAEEALAAAVA